MPTVRAVDACWRHYEGLRAVRDAQETMLRVYSSSSGMISDPLAEEMLYDSDAIHLRASSWAVTGSPPETTIAMPPARTHRLEKLFAEVNICGPRDHELGHAGGHLEMRVDQERSQGARSRSSTKKGNGIMKARSGCRKWHRAQPGHHVETARSGKQRKPSGRNASISPENWGVMRKAPKMHRRRHQPDHRHGAGPGGASLPRAHGAATSRVSWRRTGRSCSPVRPRQPVPRGRKLLAWAESVQNPGLGASILALSAKSGKIRLSGVSLGRLLTGWASVSTRRRGRFTIYKPRASLS